MSSARRRTRTTRTSTAILKLLQQITKRRFWSEALDCINAMDKSGAEAIGQREEENEDYTNECGKTELAAADYKRKVLEKAVSEAEILIALTQWTSQLLRQLSSARKSTRITVRRSLLFLPRIISTSSRE